MKYGRENESFLMWADSTAQVIVRWSPNEADKLRDALNLYFAELPPSLPPDEPTTIVGDS